jgi:hypothetical protein
MKYHLHLHADAIGIYASCVAFLFKFHELNMLLIIDMKVEITALPSYEFQEVEFKEQVAFPLRKQFVNPQNCWPEFF